MRYHSDAPDYYSTHYGKLYLCDHPLYDRCTLFEMNGKGLAIIQQYFDRKSKSTYWAEIQDWIPDRLYLSEGFLSLFEKYSGTEKNGLYPTITVRKAMWYLKMKPLKKAYWETVFDRNIL